MDSPPQPRLRPPRHSVLPRNITALPVGGGGAGGNEGGPNSYSLGRHPDDRRCSCIASPCCPDSGAGDGGGGGGGGGSGGSGGGGSGGSDDGGVSDSGDGLPTAG